MKALEARVFFLSTAIAIMAAGLHSQTSPSSGTQSASPSGTQQSPPPAKAKPKRQGEPIDPDATAGVRGTGATHTIRVLRKGVPAEGAHVVVKNTNRSVAASCDTNSAGECQVDIGADNYIVDATKKSYFGNLSISVDDSTGPIVVKLVKIKSEVNNSKP